MLTEHNDWLFGNAPKTILKNNIDNYTNFASDTSVSDGFLHIDGKGILSFPTSCSITLALRAPYFFIYIYEGELTISQEENEMLFSAGTAGLIALQDTATLRITKGRCRFFHMFLSGIPLVHYASYLTKPVYYPAESRSVFTLFSNLEHLNELQSENCQQSLFLLKTSLWITNILTEMVVYSQQPIKKKDAIPPYIEEIHTLFETKYWDQYSLKHFENTYMISKYRICREFSKFYGISPLQYLNHKRIEVSKKLLTSTDESVHRIGVSVGIPNTNHFINLFKRETGTTPLAFKQAAPISITKLQSL